MTDFADAEALYAAEKDPFYLAAFLIQHWLGGLLLRATAEYAEKKNPKERSLQSGEAWRSFVDLFHLTEGKGCRYLLGCMFRFSSADDSTANSIRSALVPLSIEHLCTGDYFGPKTVETAKLAKEGNALARLTITRWCDWLDAAIHLRTHQRWHTAPATFDPDPEIRELAAIGNAQRHLAHLSDRARACSKDVQTLDESPAQYLKPGRPETFSPLCVYHESTPAGCKKIARGKRAARHPGCLAQIFNSLSPSDGERAGVRGAASRPHPTNSPPC